MTVLEKLISELQVHFDRHLFEEPSDIIEFCESFLPEEQEQIDKSKSITFEDFFVKKEE